MKLTDGQLAMARAVLAHHGPDAGLSAADVTELFDEVSDGRIRQARARESGVWLNVEALRLAIDETRRGDATDGYALVSPGDLEWMLDAYEADLGELGHARAEWDRLRRKVAEALGRPGDSTDQLVEALGLVGPGADNDRRSLREVSAERDAAQALLFRIRALLTLDGAGS